MSVAPHLRHLVPVDYDFNIEIVYPETLGSVSMEGVKTVLSCISPGFLIHGLGDLFNKRIGGFIFSNAIGLTAVAALILAARGNVPGGRDIVPWVALSALFLFFSLWVINNLRYGMEWIRTNHQEPAFKLKKQIALLGLAVSPPIYVIIKTFIFTMVMF